MIDDKIKVVEIGSVDDEISLIEIGIPGPIGPQGYSSYEIAVQEGFVGTEKEWLESLKGQDGEDGRPGGIGGDFFELNDKGQIMPNRYCRESELFELDEKGRMTLKEDVTKPEENPRDLVPRVDGMGCIGAEDANWNEGHFKEIYGDLQGTFGGYALEKILGLMLAAGQYDKSAKEIVLSLQNDQKIRISAAGLNYIGSQGSQINVDVDSDNKIKAELKNGAVSAANLTTELSQAIANKAEQSNLEAHLKDTGNPHKTDKSHVGLSNVENIQQASKAEFEAEKLAIQAKIDRIEKIALEAERTLVFPTYQNLIDWLNGKYVRPDGKTINDINPGWDLYIMTRGVPDYWWDGSQIQELETKVDLSDYPQTAEVQAMLAVEVAKLQDQINKKEPSIAPGAVTSFIAANKTLRDLATDVRAVVLTGLSTATNTALAAADNILTAFGKLQAQINSKEPTIVTKNDAFNKSFSTTAGSALTSGGKGIAGTATTVARGDHSHDLPAYPTVYLELNAKGQLTPIL